MGYLKGLSLTAKLIGAGIVLALIAVVGWYVFLRPQHAARQAATAKTEAIQERAAAGAATDTLHIVVDRQAAEVRIIKTTEENTRDILAQPGATSVVDPALHAAGIRALCVRDGASDFQCATVLHRDGGRDGDQ